MIAPILLSTKKGEMVTILLDIKWEGLARFLPATKRAVMATILLTTEGRGWQYSFHLP